MFIVLDGPGALLIPRGVDHAVDEIELDLIAGAEPDDIRVDFVVLSRFSFSTTKLVLQSP